MGLDSGIIKEMMNSDPTCHSSMIMRLFIEHGVDEMTLTSVEGTTKYWKED